MFRIPLRMSGAFSMLVIAAQTAALDPLMTTCASTNMVFLLGFERWTCSALPLYHFIDPDRSERRRAAFGTRVVAIDPERLADRDGPLAEFGEVDADFRK